MVCDESFEGWVKDTHRTKKNHCSFECSPDNDLAIHLSQHETSTSLPTSPIWGTAHIRATPRPAMLQLHMPNLFMLSMATCLAHDSLRKGNLLAIDHHRNIGIIRRKCGLTRSVLKEFNRRAAQLALDLRRSRPAKKPRRPLTRQHLMEVRANRLRKGRQSASEFLYNCDAKRLTEIKSFAKHGGPDLSGLRGV